MNLIWGGPRAPDVNAAIEGFVAGLTGVRRGFGPSATLGVIEAETLVAGVVFHNWQPEEGVIEMSSASVSKRWLCRPVLNAMFGFCFEECGCQMVVLRVSERNAGMIDIARRFGFSETLIPRLRGRDEAEFIFTFTDDAWRGHRANYKRIL